MSKTKIWLEVVNDLKNLSDSLQVLIDVLDGDKEDTKKALPTLEEVRQNLASLSQSGKQKEVKALITKYGAKKLSDIPVGKYPELLKDAEEIQ